MDTEMQRLAVARNRLIEILLGRHAIRPPVAIQPLLADLKIQTGIPRNLPVAGSRGDDPGVRTTPVQINQEPGPLAEVKGSIESLRKPLTDRGSPWIPTVMTPQKPLAQTQMTGPSGQIEARMLNGNNDLTG